MAIKTKAQKWIIICVVCVLVLTIAFGGIFALGFFGVIDIPWLFNSDEPPEPYVFNIDFDDLAVTPHSDVASSVNNIDKTSLTLNDSISNDKDVLTSISYIYNLANQNLIEMSYYSCIAVGESTVLVSNASAGITESREYIVKDNEKWFFQNYVKAYNALSLIQNALESTEERYSSDSGNTIYKRHGGSKSLSENCIEDFLNVDTSPILYDNMAKSGSKHAPKVYSKESYNEFKHVRISYDEIDNALITARYDAENWYSTITQGSLKYDETKDLYTLEFDVDISNSSEALENGRKNLSASIGSKVTYKKQHQTIQVWGCGLFCYYHTQNEWTTGVYSLANDYNKYFTYNKSNVNKIIIPKDVSWIDLCESDALD